jgi:CBS domain containing-hemolysin-like protein
MIRRDRCATVPVTLTHDDFLRVARMCHFSRIPVWKDDPRNIIGRINVFDVITDASEKPIREYVQPLVRLSPTESVPGALLRLQQARQQMAIVVDRQSKCLGLLTLKDLVEELVGELEHWWRGVRHGFRGEGSALSGFAHS